MIISNYNHFTNSHILHLTTTLSPLSLLYLYTLSSNGFQRRRFLSFRVNWLLSSLAGAYLTTRLDFATQRLKRVGLPRFPRLSQGAIFCDDCPAGPRDIASGSTQQKISLLPAWIAQKTPFPAVLPMVNVA